jgi:hypothetical protein
MIPAFALHHMIARCPEISVSGRDHVVMQREASGSRWKSVSADQASSALVLLDKHQDQLCTQCPGVGCGMFGQVGTSRVSF